MASLGPFVTYRVLQKDLWIFEILSGCFYLLYKIYFLSLWYFTKAQGTLLDLQGCPNGPIKGPQINQFCRSPPDPSFVPTSVPNLCFLMIWQLLELFATFRNFWLLLATFGSYWQLLGTGGNFWLLLAAFSSLFLGNQRSDWPPLSRDLYTKMCQFGPWRDPGGSFLSMVPWKKRLGVSIGW